MGIGSGVPSDGSAVHWKANEPERKWSGRSSLIFILVASAVCWALLIGKALLIF